MQARPVKNRDRTLLGTLEGWLGLLVLVVYFAYPILVPDAPLILDLIVALGLSGMGLLLSF